MIYDKFENIGLYFDKSQPLGKAVDFAASFDKLQPDGRYEIDGEDIYALVMTYETKPVKMLKFESHKKYIDVQLLLEGQEYMDVSLEKDLVVDTTYSGKSDVALFARPQHSTSILLKPGNFAIVFPDDIHQPGRMVEQAEQVRKMVIKVRVQ
jgi:YhcH/YjgK/YiaL family protein